MPWNDVFTYSVQWQNFSEKIDVLTRDDLHIQSILWPGGSWSGHGRKGSLHLEREARRISAQNIVFSILVLVVLIPAALTVTLSLAAAVLVHEGSELLAVANGLQVRFFSRNPPREEREFFERKGEKFFMIGSLPFLRRMGITLAARAHNGI